MKKFTILGIAAVGVIAIGCATIYEESATSSTQPQNDVNLKKWEKAAPQLFNNVGYAKLEESIPQPVNQSESMAELIGPITNPFGIRDDILEYIVKTIPANNEMAMRAAIKLMQYMQQIYYGNLSESDALLNHSREVLAGTCLSRYMKQNPNFKNNDGGDFVYGLQMSMHNTKARVNHMWDIDRKYFSWKVLGTGLSTNEEIIACEKGEF